MVVGSDDPFLSEKKSPNPPLIYLHPMFCWFTPSKIKKKGCSFRDDYTHKKIIHTVDVRNPAPPGMYKNLQIMAKTTNLNWCRISEPATVSLSKSPCFFPRGT